MKRISRLALGRRSRWIVIATWVVLAIGLGWLQPKLQARAADESETFRARGAESTQVHQLLKQNFPEGRWSTSVLAYVAKHGSIYSQAGRLSHDTDRICASDAPFPDLVGVGAPEGSICGDLGHVLGPQSPPSAFSSDDPQSMVLLTVFNGKDDTDSVVRDVTQLRKIVPRPQASPVGAYVTGPAAFDADRALAVQGIDGTLLAITVVLVLVLMLLTYRSPLIAALMLIVVAIAYVIATGAIYGLVEAGATTVSGQSTAILIVLMFGAGTDYCLLIVSRFRDELRRDGDVEAAAARATARTSPAILASGGIVVASMLILGLADFNATREMGPILALGIVVMMAVGLTLMPALLVAFGRRVFWPSVPRVEPDAPAVGPGWKRVSALVREHPRALALGCAGLLALGALGNLEGRDYLDLSQQYRDAPESVQGQELVRKRFPPGRVAPLDLVTSAPVALQVRDQLRRTKGIADANTDSQSRDGKLISTEVLLSVDPFARSSMDMIPRIRDAARKA